MKFVVIGMPWKPGMDPSGGVSGCAARGGIGRTRLRSSWRRTVLVVAVMAVLSPAVSAEVLFLVRHAEKQAGVDPALTAAGQARARALAVLLADAGIAAVYSSDYRRTRETAQPLAGTLGLSITLYDPHDLPGLAARLREREETAIVIGHSNTTPELARILGASATDMDESEYDRLIVVSGDAQCPEATVLRLPDG